MVPGAIYGQPLHRTNTNVDVYDIQLIPHRLVVIIFLHGKPSENLRRPALCVGIGKRVEYRTSRL